ncbi:DUF3558 domain-containing protein [Amycolatopsis sp.]|jgi:hypothetical protein|uniref:DUF3558 domain-containing protein n=1 Tax=Amycolatopsis sp. TaxID=37632 RepID=UPI002E08A8D2|nr:DUF3558 domain-containing protein [Amycolatopsis sp.]
MRPRTILAAVLICAATAASCSNTTDGNATVTPSATPGGTSDALPKNGAPAVKDPLVNTTSVETDPCSALTNAQLETFGGKIDRNRVDELSLGKNCVWVYTAQFGTIAAGMTVGNKEGLSSLYYQSTHGGLTTFKPVSPVEGFPAVVYSNGGESPGVCTLAVGVRNDLTYTIITRLDTANPNRSDPCGTATKVAQLAIQQLKAA